MVDFLEKEKCCGCSACANICNFNAISMKEDSEGFMYPEINPQICYHCGACEKVCPVLNQDEKEREEPDAYAVTSNKEEILLKSSSGGVFSHLANYILNQGGIVFGAAFSSVNKVQHKAVTDKKDLMTLCGSKYVQSDINQSFCACRDLLRDNKLVLFSGTPCQIAGLNHFLKKKYDNLLTMEVICHGVPSPKVYKKYIRNIERRKRKKVRSVCFRSKDTGWENYSVKYQYEDGNIDLIKHQDDLYNQIFLSNQALRNSCYNCCFKRGKSNADITCGDFWGIRNVVPKMADNSGVSLVFCYDDKGKKYLDLIAPYLQKVNVKYKDAISGNPVYMASVRKPGSRALFFSDIRWKKIDKCIEYFCSEDGNILKKIQFREDVNDVRREKGVAYSIMWSIKNIKKFL